LDRLLTLLSAGPHYVHPADIERYSGLIRSLPMTDAPLSELPSVLEAWVAQALRNKRGSSLHAAAVLDAAKCIEAHAFGYVDERDNWEIEPLVPALADRGPRRLNSDGRLSAKIDSRLAGLIVRAELPLGSRIVFSGREAEVPCPGPLFLELQGCDLNKDCRGRGDATLLAVETDQIQYNIARRFTFLGTWWYHDQVTKLIRGTPRGELQKPGATLRIPGRWIVATLERPDPKGRRRRHKWAPFKIAQSP
jgi:hypothetical protein